VYISKELKSGRGPLLKDIKGTIDRKHGTLDPVEKKVARGATFFVMSLPTN